MKPDKVLFTGDSNLVATDGLSGHGELNRLGSACPYQRFVYLTARTLQYCSYYSNYYYYDYDDHDNYNYNYYNYSYYYNNRTSPQ